MSYVHSMHPLAVGALSPYGDPGSGESPPIIATTTSVDSAPKPSSEGLSSVIGKIGGALLGALTNKPVPPTPAVPVPTGMSSTTKVALAGGVLLAVVLLARRR